MTKTTITERLSDTKLFSVRLLFLILLSIPSIFGANSAYAFSLGHTRVTSAPGQPLVLLVPVNGLSAGEAGSLNVSVPSIDTWRVAGVNPPVPIDTLTLKLVPGKNNSSRVVEIRSSQSAKTGVIDMLLLVNTSSASSVRQITVIVPPPPNVRLSGETVTVQRGDTLIAIAQQFPVQGANLYQELWALYSSNEKAFIRQNMNLLRAGVSLKIPDPAAVRAIDPAFAKAQFLAHVRAFRSSQAGSGDNQGIAKAAVPQVMKALDQQPQQGEVEQAPKPLTAAPLSDQLKLSSARRSTIDSQTNSTDGSASSASNSQQVAQDQAVSRSKAMAEESERKKLLEQNIESLKGALAVAGQKSESVSGEGITQVANSGETAKSSGSDATKPNGLGATDSSDTGTANATGSSAANAGSVDSKRASSDTAQLATGGSSNSSGDRASNDTTRSALSNTASQNATDQSDVQQKPQVKSATNASTDNTIAGGAVNASVDGASEDVVARMGQWVKANTLAAGAILLALIAILLAWVLRSSKINRDQDLKTAQQSAAAANFETKLKSIDLSLDTANDSTAIDKRADDRDGSSPRV